MSLQRSPRAPSWGRGRERRGREGRGKEREDRKGGDHPNKIAGYGPDLSTDFCDNQLSRFCVLLL